MNFLKLLISVLLAASLGLTSTATAQRDDVYTLLAQVQDAVGGTASGDELKLAAIEGLMSAPASRALPLLRKVLSGNHSQAVKSRALFVLGQLNADEAQTLLLDYATDSTQPLRHDAIRMIGIGGDKGALARLVDIYKNGDTSVRESVLSALLIAGDAGPVVDIARAAADDDEFEAAVRTLGAMDATKELRALLDDGGKTKGLIQAYAIAGDLQSLQRIAADSKDTDQRRQAIRSIGIVGSKAAAEALMDIYRKAKDGTTREDALQGLLISDHDEGVLALFRASDNSDEKRKLLRTLIIMDSDLAMDLIDATLGGKQP